MVPDDYSEKWNEQVERITTVAKNSNINTEPELEQFVMLYILDESFSRSAILQARHEIIQDMK